MIEGTHRIRCVVGEVYVYEESDGTAWKRLDETRMDFEQAKVNAAEKSIEIVDVDGEVIFPPQRVAPVPQAELEPPVDEPDPES